MPFLPWRTKKPALLGIDITPHAVFIVGLACDGGEFSILAYAKIDLPAGNSNQALIATVLRHTLAAADTRVSSAAIAIDHSAVLFKTLEVDTSLTEDEMMCHVRNRASQYFNQPAEEPLLDFEILGPSKTHPDLRVIRWMAAKKLPIANRIEGLKLAGLHTAIVDINSYALQRAANYFYQPLTVPISSTPTIIPAIAVVYLCDESILFTVSANEIPVFTLTEQNKSWDQNSADVTATILIFIVRALQLYYNSGPQNTITLLVICGTVPDTKIIIAIQQQTHITATLADPFDSSRLRGSGKNLSSSLPHNALMQYPAHEFMLSIGLAMRANSFL